MCLFCSKVLAADSMRPEKFKRHLETTHSEYVDELKEFFFLNWMSLLNKSKRSKK